MKSLLAAALIAQKALADSADIYSQPPATVLGCECSGPCSTGILFECDVAPVCKVKSKDCAHGVADWSTSLFSHYDYCTYDAYQAYEALSAEKKKAMLMAHATSDQHSGVYPSLPGVLLGIMAESVMVSFNSSADVFPEKRKKYIHSVGVVGGVRFDSSGDHGYSGLFQGAEHGVIRFSSAKEPTKNGGTTPGMALKFLRDGRPSANFVAMYSLDGQPATDTNFFAHDWSNHIHLTNNFGLKLIAKKFWQASYCPLMVGLSDLSSDSSGKAGKFPFRLDFHALVESDCPSDDYATCLRNLENIAVGTKLFEVRAVAEPKAEPMLIGHISLTDRLTTSKFGDEELFFKHQHMEEDYMLRPAWLDAIDRTTQCGMGCAGLQAPPISKGCNSPFNNTVPEMLEDMLETDAMVI
eukprot:TRINITY_DN38943_c0_g1_i1.p1 TRINITY_DN38943_c0_g1~~TRINITY_DN38943_c0_g1_i1.p1  ORF type:complete len:410 (-),score=70.34 TRINITY_DN38943_c0_g1_i1:244-1473(-)